MLTLVYIFREQSFWSKNQEETVRPLGRIVTERRQKAGTLYFNKRLKKKKVELLESLKKINNFGT